MFENKETKLRIKKLEETFADMVRKTKWDIKKPLLWGYFFTNDEIKLLEKVKDDLIAQGYKFVDIHLSDKDNPEEPDLYWLHVEKNEIHTPQSLEKRNTELSSFASRFGLGSYDGWDVGPIG